MYKVKTDFFDHSIHNKVEISCYIKIKYMHFLYQKLGIILHVLFYYNHMQSWLQVTRLQANITFLKKMRKDYNGIKIKGITHFTS